MLANLLTSSRPTFLLFQSFFANMNLSHPHPHPLELFRSREQFQRLLARERETCTQRQAESAALAHMDLLTGLGLRLNKLFHRDGHLPINIQDIFSRKIISKYFPLVLPFYITFLLRDMQKYHMNRIKAKP